MPGDIALTFVQSAVLRDLPVCFNGSELVRVSLAAEGIWANKTYSLLLSGCFMSREAVYLQTVPPASSTMADMRSNDNAFLWRALKFCRLISTKGFDHSPSQMYSSVLFQGKIKSLLMLCLTTTRIILGFICFGPIHFTGQARPSTTLPCHSLFRSKCHKTNLDPHQNVGVY